MGSNEILWKKVIILQNLEQEQWECGRDYRKVNGQENLDRKRQQRFQLKNERPQVRIQPFCHYYCFRGFDLIQFERLILGFLSTLKVNLAIQKQKNCKFLWTFYRTKASNIQIMYINLEKVKFYPRFFFVRLNNLW